MSIASRIRCEPDSTPSHTSCAPAARKAAATGWVIIRDVLLAQVLRVLTQDDADPQKDSDEQYRAVVEMVES